VDHVRVQQGLDGGVPATRILLIKNIALLVIVGAPTLAAAVILTLVMETPARLGVTVSEVAVPMLSWLGVGNLVSVLLPVGYEPVIRRWRQRKELRRTTLWLCHLALPYGLFYIADPVYGLPQAWFWGEVHIGIAMAVWALGTAAATAIIRVRGLRLL
jgi:hypothetical protein